MLVTKISNFKFTVATGPVFETHIFLYDLEIPYTRNKIIERELGKITGLQKLRNTQIIDSISALLRITIKGISRLTFKKIIQVIVSYSRKTARFAEKSYRYIHMNNSAQMDRY